MLTEKWPLNIDENVTEVVEFDIGLEKFGNVKHVLGDVSSLITSIEVKTGDPEGDETQPEISTILEYVAVWLCWSDGESKISAGETGLPKNIGKDLLDSCIPEFTVTVR